MYWNLRRDAGHDGDHNWLIETWDVLKYNVVWNRIKI